MTWSIRVRPRRARAALVSRRCRTDEQNSRVLKLGHKVRLDEGPRAVACTSLYLDETEWARLAEDPERAGETEGPHLARQRGRWPSTSSGASLSGLVLAEIEGVNSRSSGNW